MGRIVGGILALIAIYALYFYNDGTLFSQISDALGRGSPIRLLRMCSGSNKPRPSRDTTLMQARTLRD